MVGTRFLTLRGNSRKSWHIVRTYTFKIGSPGVEKRIKKFRKYHDVYLTLEHNDPFYYKDL